MHLNMDSECDGNVQHRSEGYHAALNLTSNFPCIFSLLLSCEIVQQDLKAVIAILQILIKMFNFMVLWF